MSVQDYQCAHEFLENNESYLDERAVENSLLHGLAIKIRDKEFNLPSPPLLLSVQSLEPPKIWILQTPPKPLVASAVENVHLNQQVLELVSWLYQRQHPVPGVNGPSFFTDLFASIWEEQTGITAVKILKHRLYHMLSAPEVSAADGEFRSATDEDLPVISEWIQIFSAEAVNEILSIEEAEEIARTKMDHCELFVWTIDHKLVSLAATARPVKTGITINYVYTPKEYRGQGYASQCVRHLCRKLFSQGWQFCMLYADLQNPISNHIYQKMGFTFLTDHDLVLFHSDDKD